MKSQVKPNIDGKRSRGARVVDFDPRIVAVAWRLKFAATATMIIPIAFCLAAARTPDET